MVSRKKSDLGRGGKLFYWGMLAVPIICFIMFYIIINFNSIILAFQDYWYDGGKIMRNFNNFQSFKNLFLDLRAGGKFKILIGNSILYIGLLIVIVIPVTLLFAYYIYQKHLFYGFFKVFVFTPSVVCMMVLVIFYDGFVEYALASVLKPSTAFMSKNSTTLPFLIIFYVCCGFSSNLLIFLNAMSQISSSSIEAAKIDGAGELKIFLKIVIPSIWGTIVSMVVITFAAIGTEQGNVHAFLSIKPKILENYSRLQTIGYYIFTGVLDGNGNLYEPLFPKISAFGVLITVVITPVTILFRNLMTKFGPSED